MIIIKKRGSVYQYCFEAGKVNGKRKQITKSGFKTKNEAYIEGQKHMMNLWIYNEVTSKEFNMLYDYLYYCMKEYLKINYKYSTAKRYKSFSNIKKAIINYKLSSLTSYILNHVLLKLYQTSSTERCIKKLSKNNRKIFKR